ncbi:MAG TPA: oligopeptide/dipeptide ABC transporter ATP-binding protein [Polyangiaceae bacterium]|nr:oligopeptide/dipeptide ABC transporter ATP-binding protein [Polyangiaceae bacterium]
MSTPLLRVEGLTKHFPVTRGVLGRIVGQVRAVDGVSFDIARGETLGLVGESGSGKTTVGRSILRLIEPTAGNVVFDGIDVRHADPSTLRQLRRSMQIIFQDPYSSLNPRLRVLDLIGEALEVHGLARGPAAEKRVAELLTRVGLAPGAINRYPHEFSGGQRQRIGVARAIALEPKLIVCDEPVSALDVSIQAQVVNLLKDLGRELGLSYLFIAHDLSVVRHLSHRIAVMYLGELVELAPGERLFSAPAHPYTRALLSAVPVPDPRRRRRRSVLEGDLPSPMSPPSGCRFHTRCPAVMERCRTEPPPVYRPEPGHEVRCFHSEGASGDGWYAEVDARIEAQTAQNQRATPAPPRVQLEPRLADAAPGVRDIAAASPAHGRRSTRHAPPRISASRRTKALYVLPFMLLGAFFLARSAFRDIAAQRELKALSAELVAKATLTGALPASIADLGWRLPPLFGPTGALDPWGHSFRYRVLPGGNGFELATLGPDGVKSSDDQLVVRRLTFPARR